MRTYIKVALVFIVIFGLIFLVYENNHREVVADSEHNAVFLMKNTLDEKLYDRFKETIIDSRRNIITEEEFNELSQVTTAGWTDESYRLLKFDNGRMLLVNLSPVKIDGKYYIHDVIEVPNNMKGLFDIEHKVSK